MGKFTLAVIALYILYYSGNIIYDLFFKKQRTIKTDDEEVFAIADVAEQVQPEIINIGIEDAETLNTPSSFTPNIHEEIQYDTDAVPDLEELRRRFEFEESLDGFPDGDFMKAIETKTPFTVQTMPMEKETGLETKQSDEIQQKLKHEEMLSLASTSVIVCEEAGVKLYRSALFNEEM